MGVWTPGFTLAAIEQAAIEEALRFYRNNKTQTAQSLDIAVRTLDAKLEKYEFDRGEQEKRRADDNAQRQEFLQRQRGLASPTAGVRVESAPEIGAESKVSMPERAQVQEVLPRPVAKGSAKKTG